MAENLVGSGHFLTRGYLDARRPGKYLIIAFRLLHS